MHLSLEKEERSVIHLRPFENQKPQAARLRQVNGFKKPISTLP